jgi:hypothetical protein
MAKSLRSDKSPASKAALALKALGKAKGLGEQGCRGDLDALEKAVALGWHPSMDDSSSFDVAMREPSGEAIAWLMERFPLAAAASSALSRPKSDRSSGWSLSSMVAAEPFGMELATLSNWARACAASGMAARYFEASMVPGSVWAPWTGASQKDTWPSHGARLERLDAALNLALKEMGASAEVAAQAVRFAAPLAKASLDELGDDPVALHWRSKMFEAIRSKALRGEPLAPLGPLLDLLDPIHTHSGSFKLSVPAHAKSMGKNIGQAPMAPRVQDRSRYWSQMMAVWTSERAWGSENARSIGLVALVGKSDANFMLALDRGWIERVPAETMGSCENPSFIAFDQKKIEEKVGQPVPMQKRWNACRAAIDNSSLEEREKARLLAICDGAPAEAWTEGRPTRLPLPVTTSVSPMEIFLVGAGSFKTPERAQALSARGFLASDARASFSVLSDEVGVSGKPAWLSRLIESEEIAKAAGRPERSTKPKAL